MALDLGMDSFSFSKFETWPQPLRIGAGLVVCALIVAISWFVINQDQSDELTGLIGKETQLREEYKTKARQAANLDAYKDQIVELESLLDAQLRQLPNSNEVANLLDDISFIAQDNGLNLLSIKWEPEVQQEIYTELPMSINVTGTYEQLGSFSADTAALPRIVTIDKFSLQQVESKDSNKNKDKTVKTGTGENDNLLSMDMLAKTFRYNADQQNKNRHHHNAGNGGK